MRRFIVASLALVAELVLAVEVEKPVAIVRPADVKNGTGVENLSVSVVISRPLQEQERPPSTVWFLLVKDVDSQRLRLEAAWVPFNDKKGTAEMYMQFTNISERVFRNDIAELSSRDAPVRGNLIKKFKSCPWPAVSREGAWWARMWGNYKIGYKSYGANSKETGINVIIAWRVEVVQDGEVLGSYTYPTTKKTTFGVIPDGWWIIDNNAGKIDY